MMHLVEDFAVSDPLAALPDHTLEDILARVPLASVGASRCVSKRWRALTTSPTFLAGYSQRQEQSESWLYVNGYRYRITDIVTSPGDALPGLSSTAPASKTAGQSWGAGGVAYVLSEYSQAHQNVRYKLSAVHPDWQETPALTHRRVLPIVAAIKNLRNGAHMIFCAGGLRADAEKLEPLAKVELFDSESNTWEECEDVPGEFQGLACSRSVTAVVCQRKLYLFHIYSGIVASFDVVTKRWSKVVTLRPPEMEYCYLAVRNCEPLLVGVSNENNNFSFLGWKVDRGSMECTGDSWPVLCHFASVQTSVDVSKQKQEAWLAQTTSLAVSSSFIPLQPIFFKYFVAVAACFSRRVSRITEVIDNVLEFWKAIT
ncbi:hypothetical protein M758_2G228300 [Ceratodon purpureus]|nr:hypothetical protein M758_2G228300 [Ceratodon purpureus]